MKETEIKLRTEWIRLDGLLKFSGAAETGGTAKSIIQGGEVWVNGQPCTERGRKLRSGDVVVLGELRLMIR